MAPYHICTEDETRTHTAERPLPPQSSVSTNFTTSASEILSEKRDSNPRPRPWQGRALPTELFSRIVVVLNLVGSFAGAKIEAFFYTSKFFHLFFSIFLYFIAFIPIYSKLNLAKVAFFDLFSCVLYPKTKKCRAKSPTLKH